MKSTINITAVKEYLLDLQNLLCKTIEHEDGKVKFAEDCWNYATGHGGGITRTIIDGAVIEKGGVNFSHIIGATLPIAATVARPDLTGCSFQAMGISSVIHPLNPYVPTAHMNVRLFVAEKKNQEPIWWFGGGFDLTPYYGFNEDCIHWHKTAQAACTPFGANVYPQLKQQADEYFYLKHRQEPRGIGGILFDDLSQWGFEQCFAFIQSVGDHFSLAYQPIIAKRKQHTYTPRERNFQLYRRGRYVEFNLIYDRGTLFGLQSGGRTESILMSLPPHVTWQYNWHPEPGTSEATLYEKFLIPRDWVNN